MKFHNSKPHNHLLKDLIDQTGIISHPDCRVYSFLSQKPYRPQTNGKIERFWKTLKEDFTDDSLFNNKEDLKEELLGYIVYYNEHRPHSSLNGNTPAQFCKSCN